MKNINSLAGLATLISALLFSACGGGGSSGGNGSGSDSGGDSDDGGSTSTEVSGTAAAGAPVIGQVTVKGAEGNSKSALIEADGSYTVDVTGLTAPYRLRAEGTVGGRTVKLHSYAEDADLDGTVNITPFTDLIVANAAQQIASSFFDSETDTSLDAAVVAEQETALQEKLQDVFDALGVDTAVDLLRTAFSADHSGLDAALDAITVEVDTSTNIATITTLLGDSITDDVLDTTDNTDTLTVADTNAFTEAVSDVQAITAIFDSLSTAFADGLPNESEIQSYFSDDFMSEDAPKSAFLTDITTDPSIVGLTFNSVSVFDLDAAQGTATVTFYVSMDGLVDPLPETWFAVKDATEGAGWQLRGDQRIVDLYFGFHCNDYDGSDDQSGTCGINTRFWDDDFSNNGTANAPIASGTVSIIDGANDTEVKAVIYLGTPDYAAPGDVQIWDEGGQLFSGDWKAFGNDTGQIDSSVFQVGDIIEYKLYTEDLDVANAAAPQIAANATAIATYRDTLIFAPATTGAYPIASSETVTAISNFSLGDSLTLEWTLSEGTLSDEILIEISDSQGNRLELWDNSFGPTETSTTIASTQLDSAVATDAGLDPEATSYNLVVRIYTLDQLTGQAHSTDYRATVDGPAAQ